MIATRTRSSERGRPLLEPFFEATVSFLGWSSRSESVSTISWVTERFRSDARCASFVFNSVGMRKRTSPLALGRPPRRPEPWKGTAKRDARIATATSFRLPPRASTSWARRRLRSAGMRTRTSLRSLAIRPSDSTNVLSDAAELLANEEDALQDREPGRRREKGDRARQYELVDRGEDEAGGDHDDAFRATPESDVTLETQCLRARTRVADEERACDCRERERDAPHLPVPHEDEPDRAEHEALPDAIDSRIQERAERTSAATASRQRAVEDVENRADDEERCGVHVTIVPAKTATPIPAATSSQKWFPLAMTENQTQPGQSVQRSAAMRLRTSIAIAKPTTSASAACTLGMAAN